MTRTLAFILTASLAACAGEAEVRYSGNAAAPELVTLDTDASVQVVANADEPIFFSENTYYLYRDDHWYRSRSHRTGWKRIDSPPDHISRIERPMAYIHFRHGGDAQRTTLNQTGQAPQPPENAEPVQPLQQPAQPAQPLPPPSNQPPTPPNPQGPNQPYANPPPPQQLPPTPDPTLRPTRPMPPDQVPTPSPDPVRPGDHTQPRPDPKDGRTPPPPEGKP
jgi:hypothetical protein